MKSAASRRVLLVSCLFVLFIIPVILFISSCGRWLRPTPRLTIVIIVDQLRADYLQRYAGYFSSGLARLQRGGAVFLNARHQHACTETAPGHATLSTGSHPLRHGIVSNSWFDAAAGKSVYAVADSQVITFDSSDLTGRSPHFMQHSGLGDWLKKEHADAKVISISRKDRAAILLGGQKPDAAYWFNTRNGGFTSSSYYLDKLPPWVVAWNNRHEADKFFQRAWEKMRPEEEYFVSREDLFDGETDAENSVFPHAYASADSQPGEAFYRWLTGNPFADELTLAFAAAALRAEQLGDDRTPDLLCISLSSTDAVGHGYGPLSQEMQDNIMRLDQKLGDFFAEVDRQVGLENYLIALSSDHGVLPLPEELRRRGFASARISDDELKAELDGVLVELAEELGTRRPLLKNTEEGLYLDYAAADSAGLSRQAFQQRVAAKISSLSFVAEVFTPADLAAANSDGRDFAEQFRHSFFSGRSPDLLMRLKPYYLVSPYKSGTSHGSVYDYDSQVPMMFMGKGINAGQFTTPCATVDFAPTLATLMHLSPPDDIDGKGLNLTSPDGRE